MKERFAEIVAALDSSVTNESKIIVTEKLNA
jgi:hypothetical protein